MAAMAVAAGRSRGYRRYQRVRVDAPPPGSVRSGAYVVAIVVLSAAVAIAYVWFHSADVRLGRDVDGLRREFAIQAKEVENLHVQVESYRSGRYIGAAVKRFGLKLRDSIPGQIRWVEEATPAGRSDWVAGEIAARN